MLKIYGILQKFIKILYTIVTLKKKVTAKKQENKNTLTGPANCKKTTRYRAHLSLCAKSRKTNKAKSRKWP